MLLWCLILVVSTMAFCLSAVSGGGAGLILIPLMGLVMPASQIPAALSIGTAVSSAARIVLFRKAIRWDVVRHFAPTALPFAALGAWALSCMNPIYLSLFLGLFLIGNLPLIVQKHPVDPVTKPIRPVSLHILGGAVGFISGFTGTVGLIFNGFYYRMGLRKEEIVATRAANEIMLHLLKIILYAILNLLNFKAITVGAAIATAGILSSVIMAHLLRYLHDHLFRHIGYISMVAAGIVMMITSGRQIMHKDNVSIHYTHASEEISASLSWRQHVFTVEWERGDELELSHRQHASEEHGKPNGFIMHLSLHAGLQTVRTFDS
ncbi:hypothetical protein AA0242T_2343 [Acetobacter aceti NRIC 0242]|uniref:Probable membrane transporter protein n=2 Tax=Acetobacter aceti TaxID=435 RepID=A0A6S6PM81_ACEAC|nr:sulfite exporter TauE/SafE family protein [Acetobacter aceti]GBO81641.1 hypothetical protein AA0242T_2343 [Acetobacter aceti NRIC 0242]TCS31981.1 hypothetical protein EDC15_11314 [Acetobacter aceti NBRC 14818]BCI66314.1 hypothetical protein AAJCM20276_09380 [Acetobacter aceti]BCK77282.1 hypothetical protein EMQ_2888 [Acetobacter aceti NBRC 14818]GAN58393.1 hypothetical protein Abac_048_027 [Acetobacter aceti NBRC 14818]